MESGHLGLQELKDQRASFREHSGEERAHPSSFRQKHHEENGKQASSFDSVGGLHKAHCHRGRPCPADDPGGSRADQGAIPGADYLREAREGALSPEQASKARSNHEWASPSSPEWLHWLWQHFQWHIHSGALSSFDLRFS